ncbi:hypothetical protein [Williamsia sterculiae]|uniref:Uncharacterized protein n=1 Tax=Williamsia sterculiae TaxID=1344003 RepID=A0A1N7EJ47_9NOCA|nr:hypothetical protein [Williamsia sterculiae]SIR88077.1 hypothetical protein SAMN05445060_1364 [Williamsia sterculiae]
MSVAFDWIRQGYLSGDPVATALFIGLFAVGGVWTLISGGSF